MLEKRYRFVPPGGGPNYDWTRDHTFVKVAAADTGGAYALMEDNLKREFALGLHLHRQHPAQAGRLGRNLPPTKTATDEKYSATRLASARRVRQFDC